MQAPLQEAVSPQGLPILVKNPFLSSDFINWKESTGSYCANPEKVYRVFQIGWKDMQVLLNAILHPEERILILEKANEENRRVNVR